MCQLLFTLKSNQKSTFLSKTLTKKHKNDNYLNYIILIKNIIKPVRRLRLTLKVSKYKAGSAFENKDPTLSWRKFSNLKNIYLINFI